MTAPCEHVVWATGAAGRLCGAPSAGIFTVDAGWRALPGWERPSRALCARHVDLALAAGWRPEIVERAP